MNIVYALLLSTLAGLSTVIGGLFIYLKISNENINKFITFSLSFSLSIMIGISIFDLLPESIFVIYKAYPSTSLFIIFSLFFISFLLVKLINHFMKNNENNLYKLGILSMITLMIHNFPEGIATFLSSYDNLNLGIKLSLAIAMHNIPEGIAIAVPIYYSTGSYKKAMKKTIISGLSEPLGAIIAYIFLAKYITHTFISLTLVVVSGLMISLAIEKMLPEAKKYYENKYIYIGLILGFLIIFINLML